MDRDSSKNLLRMILAVLFSCTYCIAQSQWTWQNPIPQANTLNSAAEGKGMIVMVGENVILGCAGTGFYSTLIYMQVFTFCIIAIGALNLIINLLSSKIWYLSRSNLNIQTLNSLYY